MTQQACFREPAIFKNIKMKGLVNKANEKIQKVILIHLVQTEKLQMEIKNDGKSLALLSKN